MRRDGYRKRLPQPTGHCPLAAARPAKEDAAGRRSETRSREAGTALSLFYTEMGNNVGEWEVTQMSGQPPRPVGPQSRQAPWEGHPPLS